MWLCSTYAPQWEPRSLDVPQTAGSDPTNVLIRDPSETCRKIDDDSTVEPNTQEVRLAIP